MGYELIKVSALNSCAEGSEVDYASLLSSRAVSKAKLKLNKVVGSGDDLAVKGLTVKAHAFTDSAKATIGAAGGKCVLLSPTTNLPLNEYTPGCGLSTSRIRKVASLATS